MKIIIKAIIILMVTSFSIKAFCQIHFEKGLSWKQIKDKAKAEHKYIFVDCFATWCGPCKQMDQEVYNRQDVGITYNKDFISVRLQMDQTAADNDTIKGWYSTVTNIQTLYTVHAYPTFLFFDSEGKPVHRITGAMAASAFIHLALDVQDPNKQYYRVLKNFEPGKLDTAEEKGLAHLLASTDNVLAGKIAADYLNRKPRQQLADWSNGQLMVNFQDNPQVLNIAVEYIRSFGESNFSKEENTNFIKAFSSQTQVAAMVGHYFSGLRTLSKNQLSNLSLLATFWRDSQIKSLANSFINQLPEKEMYNAATIGFIASFTDSTTQRGFSFFYHNAARIDTIMKDPDLAQSTIRKCIGKTEWSLVIAAAKQSGNTPDFDKVTKAIVKKYNQLYASATTARAKEVWYRYLVNDKKQDQFWPQLVDAEIDQIKAIDTERFSDYNVVTMINNICWDAYLHSNDPKILGFTAVLMADLNKKKTDNVYLLDTYASVLYKAGQTDQAIKVENQAVQVINPKEHPIMSKPYLAKIDAMKRNEKIWLDKDYQ